MQHGENCYTMEVVTIDLEESTVTEQILMMTAQAIRRKVVDSVE